MKKLKHQSEKNYLIMFKLLTLLLIMSLYITGCSNNDEIGYSKNPKLNHSEYLFDKSGESIEIYSTLNYQITPVYQPIEDSKEPTISYNNREIASDIKGDWYNIKFDENTNRYIITVDENKTENKRVLPIMFIYKNWSSGSNKYIQK